MSPGAAVGLGGSSTATFTAVLDAQPTSDVTLLASSSDNRAAVVAPATLTFTTANWNTPQTVTVTGVADDDVVDEVVNVTVAVDDATSDDDFDPVADQTLTATVTDDDSPGFTLSQTTATLTEGTTTTFTATLDAQPTTNVVLLASSSDSGAASVSPTNLTFTPANGTPPRRSPSSPDPTPTWPTNRPPSPSPSTTPTPTTPGTPWPTSRWLVTVTDDDSAGVTLSSAAVAMNESGTATFTAVLDAQPASDVVIDSPRTTPAPQRRHRQP